MAPELPEPAKPDGPGAARGVELLWPRISQRWLALNTLELREAADCDGPRAPNGGRSLKALDLCGPQTVMAKELLDVFIPDRPRTARDSKM